MSTVFSQNDSGEEIEVQAALQLIEARHYLYLVFHKLLGGEPTQELVGRLASPATQEAFSVFLGGDEDEAAFDTVGRARSVIEGDALDKVASEWSHLFVDSHHLGLYPWESPHVSKKPLMFQTSTLDVRERYRAYGFEAKGIGKMPDDHVSLMCHFMAELSCRTEEAFRAGDLEVLGDVLADQHHFLRDHMTNWLPSLLLQAEMSGDGVLYVAAIRDLSRFAQMDEALTAQLACWSQERSDDGELLCAVASGPNGENVELQHATKILEEVRTPHLEENELRNLETA